MAANPGQPSGQNLLQRILNIENLLGINGASNALFRVADANGVQRIRIGLLPNGDYGILLNDLLGNVQELLPAVSSFWINALQTSSVSPVTIASSPSVTIDLGNSGDCYVELASQITGQASGDQGFVYCYVDGANVIGSNNTWCLQGGYGPYSQSMFVKFKLSQALGKTLTPGSHTFTLKYAASPGGVGNLVDFEFNVLTITPI
jgi:hypothetical protein